MSLSLKAYAVNRDSVSVLATAALSEHENKLKEGKWEEALASYKKYCSLSDTLASLNKIEEQEKSQEKEGYEQQKQIRDLENLRKEKVAEAEKKKNKTLLFLIGTVGILLISFLIFVFRSLRKLKTQKVILEKKSLETEHQKSIIEERNKDLRESLHYAGRIQRSLMPTDNYFIKVMRKN